MGATGGAAPAAPAGGVAESLAPSVAGDEKASLAAEDAPVAESADVEEEAAECVPPPLSARPRPASNLDYA